ncbi:MAG: phytanoyl-CoA dioxygenase family protein [Pseudomonadota bacterium]
MTPEAVLSHPPLILEQSAREAYFRDGFVTCPALIGGQWLERLTEATSERLRAARDVASSNDDFDIGPGHGAQHSGVRRLRKVVDQHPTFWSFASSAPMTEIAADLVGPDVKFHSAKLNFKHPRGGAEIHWHQDIPAWPHTNYSPVTIGVYLDDVTAEQGPLRLIPGSHRGPLFDHYCDGEWSGRLTGRELEALDTRRAVEAIGPAGTVVAINCRTVHGSASNLSSLHRSLLLYVYSSADAFTYTAAPTPTRYTGAIVRGFPARWSHVDPRPCALPPDWERVGYGSIYSAQIEDADIASADD